LTEKKISKKNVSIINLLFNYANTAFAIVNGLILVPIYLKHFSIDTYGSYLSSGSIVGMLGVLEAGMNLVFTQKLSTSYAKKDLESFTKILGAGLFISLILTIILILVALGLLPFIAHWVKAVPNEYKNIQYAFLLSAIGAGFTISYQNVSAVFQAWLKVKVCGYINIFSIILGIISTVVGLQWGLGVVSIPLGIFVKSFSGLLVISLFLNNNLKRKNYPKIVIEQGYCSELLKSSMPLLGGNIAKSLLNNSQLLIITAFINPTSSAIFTITGKVYQVCGSFLAPIGSSIFSSVSQLVGEGDFKKIKETILKIFILFTIVSILILSVGFALNSAFVSLWIGADKFGGVLLSLLLCINVLINSRMNFIGIILIFGLIKVLGFVVIPFAELVSTVFLSGYFLNRLIITKLKLNSNEAIQFIFCGMLVACITFVAAFFWQLYFPVAKNWKILIAQSIMFVFIGAIISLLASQNSRKVFSGLIRFINRKMTVLKLSS
jgi:O-antigen/teichoic acid export membrane protein